MTVDAEKLIEQARLVPESRGNALVNALADEVERLTAENVSLREANLRRSLERDEARADRDRLAAAAEAYLETQKTPGHVRFGGLLGDLEDALAAVAEEAGRGR